MRTTWMHVAFGTVLGLGILYVIASAIWRAVAGG